MKCIDNSIIGLRTARSIVHRYAVASSRARPQMNSWLVQTFPKGQTINETPTGYWEWFRKDGTKMRSGHFVEGAQVGEWTTYDKLGQVYKVTQVKRKAAT